MREIGQAYRRARPSGDSETKEARVHRGQWQAWGRQLSLWMPVPEARSIRERNPNILDTRICWTKRRGIVCFNPPDTGG